MRGLHLTAFAAVISAYFCSAAQIRTDPVKSGPELEVVHLFNGQWPTGIAVSKSGRKFSCFPAGLDPANTNNGLNNKIQVAELKNGKEIPYPSKKINNPPGGAVNRLSVPPVTRGTSDYLLGVQSVVVDPNDTLWILDTGRVTDLTDPAAPLLNSTFGGPKLISVDLTTDKITKTIVFPADVALSQSYPNDIRFDLERGFAYLSDSSPEGFNGIIVVNLKTGKSFRRLTGANAPTHPIPSVVPWVAGSPMYQILNPIPDALNPGYITFGVDGIGLDPTGETLYFSAIAGRFLYSVPTAALRDRSSNVLSQVKNLGEKGISDGLEVDTKGMVYAGNAEQNGISIYNPRRGLATMFVRDPRINWVDTMSIAEDGYLYFTVNQLNDLQAIYPGKGIPLMDRRQPPYVVFRAKLPNGGTKITGNSNTLFGKG